MTDDPGRETRAGTTADDVVVLVGPMGAGKTSVGRRVARGLGTRFTDTDKAIARRHGPIPAIFAEHGEQQFRLWERDAVAEALESGGVVSLGGGAVVTASVRELLRPVPVVLLTVSPEAVADRIAGSSRPLLSGAAGETEASPESALERWRRIADERAPWYAEVADAVFDTSRVPMTRVADQIVEWMRGRA
ncbi:shikimate kinase [Microbacterium resistens]|uniref:shikimate kinase n=1 Tax=Microbacterium resistens TaxID=156977 RepID=UPI001C580C68|nr:shikimate kinase [Microbacterium resistens]MBW1637902.1 shikimate kinase [Microbacterium resistens]